MKKTLLAAIVLATIFFIRIHLVVASHYLPEEWKIISWDQTDISLFDGDNEWMMARMPAVMVIFENRKTKDRVYALFFNTWSIAKLLKDLGVSETFEAVGKIVGNPWNYCFVQVEY